MEPIKFIQGANNPGIAPDLPSNGVTWNNARNVRFKQSAVYKHPGKLLLKTLSGNPRVLAQFSFLDSQYVFQTIVCTASAWYAVTSAAADFDTVSVITPTGYLGGRNYSFTVVGGIPYLSDGVNVYQWNAASSGAMVIYSTGANPTTIWAWDRRLWMTDGYTITCSGVSNANATSIDLDPDAGLADGGAGMSSFGRGTVQFLSSEVGLDANEVIKGAVPTPNAQYLFTWRGVWRCVKGAAGDFIWEPLPQITAGALTRNLIVPVNGPRGFTVLYMGNNDVYEFDGTNSASIGIPIRKTILGNLNKSALNSSFSFYNPVTYEAFFCVSTGSNGGDPDTSIIYNLETKAFTVCDCNFISQSLAYKANAAQWTSVPESFYDLSANGVAPYSALGDAYGKIYEMDGSIDDNGAVTTSWIETGDFSAGGRRITKLEFVPELNGVPSNQPINITVGARDSLRHDIIWGDPQQITPGLKGSQGRKITARTNGFYVRIKITTNTLGSDFSLIGYEMPVTLGGIR
jgi:hypothetical protein